MELLYVWIEDYKNIHHQGFNFSPKYRFKFEPTEFETIEDVNGKPVLDKNGKERERVLMGTLKSDGEEKNVLPEKFFGEWVVNITAIVGQNGSGKSNLVKGINYIFHNLLGNTGRIVPDFLRKIEFLIIFGIEDNLEIYHSFLNGIVFNQRIIEETKINTRTLKFSSIFFSNVFDGMNERFDCNNIFDISTNSLYKDPNIPTSQYVKNEFKNQIDFAVKIGNEDLKSTFPFEVPKRLHLEMKNWNAEARHRLWSEIWSREKSNKASEEMKIFEDCIDKVFLTNDFNEMIAFEILIVFILEYSSGYDYIHIDDIIPFLKKLETKVTGKTVTEKIDFLDEIKDFLLEWQNDSGNSSSSDSIKFLIQFIEKSEALEKCLSGHEKIVERLFILFLCKDIDPENANTIKEFFDSYFEAFNTKHTIERKYEQIKYQWMKMSSGQLAMLNIFSRFYSVINSAKKKYPLEKNLILFIDEGELYLHADWQKKFLNSLLGGMQEIFKEHKLQIILTSHTPFVLSDIPKENVIFLNKDENGKCIVVDGLKEKKQTFGANIHTLFSDSFFLEGGLIGEFAKGKIQEVIDYLNGHPNGRWKEINEKNNKEVQTIINMIGEPILRMQLQKMIDSKRLQKIDEIDKIKEEISSLQNRLTVIENLKQNEDESKT